jgi:hypothetical protein
MLKIFIYSSNQHNSNDLTFDRLPGSYIDRMTVGTLLLSTISAHNRRTDKYVRKTMKLT